MAVRYHCETTSVVVSQLDELDVEGILAFAERVLPRGADLWV
jgi:hypothetical protein